MRKLVRVGAHFEHVVARPEAEPFQRQLQGLGAGAAEPGADDPHGR
jgi:hypothetical protein